jgi:hypothetical protein
MNRIKLAGIFATTALGLLLACGSAQAQLYHYKDASGRTVYSDTPPPPETPAGNILKTPKVEQAAPAAPSDGKDGKATAPKSTAEREADYKKRMAEADKKGKEDSQKSAQEERRKAQCAGLQTNLAAMQSGQRLRKFDANGNPYFVEDAERAADIAKAQAEMSNAKCN